MAPANSAGGQTCSADPVRLRPRAPVGVETTGNPAAMKSNILMLVPEPENIGFTEKQYASLQALLAEIYARHPDVKPDRRHVVGHSDYAPGRRTDPGELFDWSKIDLPKEAGR